MVRGPDQRPPTGKFYNWSLIFLTLFLFLCRLCSPEPRHGGKRCTCTLSRRRVSLNAHTPSPLFSPFHPFISILHPHLPSSSKFGDEPVQGTCKQKVLVHTLSPFWGFCLTCLTYQFKKPHSSTLAFHSPHNGEVDFPWLLQFFQRRVCSAGGGTPHNPLIQWV